MTHLQRVVIRRQDNGSGVAERFYVQPGRHYGRWIWFDPEEVPPLEGAEAPFEIERRQKRWVVVRAAP